MNPSLADQFRSHGRGHGATLDGVLGLAREHSQEATWSLIARRRLDGPPIADHEGVAWLARTCYERTVDRFDAVIAVTGDEGMSKSTFCLKLEQEIAKLSGVEWAWDNLCYDARDVFKAYQRAKSPATTIIYDESVRGLMAGETFKEDQVRLSRGLMLWRVKRAIFLLAIPDVLDLALKVRGRRATFWVHVNKRGTERMPAPSEALFFERDTRLRFKKDDSLRLARSRRCPSIEYEPFAETDPFWLQYRSYQSGRLDEFIAKELEEMDLSDAKKALARERFLAKARAAGLVS